MLHPAAVLRSRTRQRGLGRITIGTRAVHHIVVILVGLVNQQPLDLYNQLILLLAVVFGILHIFELFVDELRSYQEVEVELLPDGSSPDRVGCSGELASQDRDSVDDILLLFLDVRELDLLIGELGGELGYLST